MFWIFSFVYEAIVNLTTEFVVYVFIDVWAKNLLNDARDEEKRKIWLWESAVVAIAALLLMSFHHTPYILILLSACTFLYTQLLGRVNFRYWWRQLVTRWDEFQQHEESMEHYHELLQTQQERNAAAVSSIPFPNVPPVAKLTQFAPVTTGYGLDPNSVEPWYPDERGGIMSGPYTLMHNNMPPNITPTSQLRYRFEPAFQTSAPIYANSIMTSKLPPVRQQDLMRRPIHSNVPFAASRRGPVETTSLKNRFMSVLGKSPSYGLHPGLPNSGRQVCFMNSVLQCMAHIPGLAECLSRDCQTLRCTAHEADLVISASNLFQSLASAPEESAPRVVQHDILRESASKLPRSVVVSPNQGLQQHQQDCAEFFMWLTENLHTALNSCRPLGTGNNQNQLDNRPKYQNVCVNMMKYVYGDLSKQRVEHLIVSCKQQIDSANGSDTKTYVEPLQRLSDFEWLHYKALNNSVLDDLFTGQLVETHLCTACNKMSVGIQTFNILPVPIVEPRQMNGLVYLEDCFIRFGRMEKLVGPDGLRCERCNKVIINKLEISVGASPVLSNGAVAAKSLIQTVQKRRLNRQFDASGTPGMAGMSPIANTLSQSDSIHEFKTSTPIQANNVPYTLTDGERRSFLRQLPDCLVVQLLRFSVTSYGDSCKLTRPVQIALTQLDLTSLVIDNVMQTENMTSSVNNSFRYDLYGVCVHVGANSMQNGHYIAYVKTRQCGWCKCDDETVTQVNMQYELCTKQLRENAYLLFYRKTAGP